MKLNKKQIFYFITALLLLGPISTKAQTVLDPAAAALSGSTSTNHYGFGLCGTNYGNFSSSDTEELYSYTATADAPCVSLVLDPMSQYTGVFIYENALPTSSSDACYSSAFSGVSGNTAPVTANFSLVNGTTYYFVVTSEGEGDVDFTIDLNIPVVPTPYVVMSNASIEIDATTTMNFFDSGGSACGYSTDEDYELTVCPDAAGLAANQIVQLDFTDFDVNNTCIADLPLRFYKGTSATSGNELFPESYTPQLWDGNGSGQGDIRRFRAITPNGCMTVSWKSNADENCLDEGWEANFTLVDNPCSTTLMTDECADAPQLIAGASLSSTSDCDFTGGASACGIGFNNNAWFKFTPTLSNIEIDYAITGGNACYGGTGSDDFSATGIQMALFASCSGGTPVAGSCIITGGIDVDAGTFASGTWEVSGLVANETYYAMFDGYAGDLCDFSVTGGTGVALPVELFSFSAFQQKEVNKITWSTATEENTQWHIIERSANGRDFEEIGSVQAAGTSANLVHYDFEDQRPLATSYYRLKSVDFDRTLDFSEVITVQRSGSEINVARLFPNPTNNTLFVELSADQNRSAALQLNNLFGDLLLQKDIDLTKTNQIIEIDMTDYPSGVYFLTLTGPTVSETFRFVNEELK